MAEAFETGATTGAYDMFGPENSRDDNIPFAGFTVTVHPRVFEDGAEEDQEENEYGREDLPRALAQGDHPRIEEACIVATRRERVSRAECHSQRGEQDNVDNEVDSLEPDDTRRNLQCRSWTEFGRRGMCEELGSVDPAIQ